MQRSVFLFFSYIHLYQTSVDPSVEESALKTFVVFEKGDSGDLGFNQFQKVSGGGDGFDILKVRGVTINDGEA